MAAAAMSLRGGAPRAPRCLQRSRTATPSAASDAAWEVGVGYWCVSVRLLALLVREWTVAGVAGA
eukprot:324653-Chlamydomonas_euryale.AAC.1